MTTDDLDKIRQRLGTTSYSPWKDDTFALLDEVERLRSERDRAREECGHEKHMRKFVSDERDDFIAAKMRAEAERDRLAATVDRVRKLADNQQSWIDAGRSGQIISRDAVRDSLRRAIEGADS